MGENSRPPIIIICVTNATKFAGSQYAIAKPIEIIATCASRIIRILVRDTLIDILNLIIAAKHDINIPGSEAKPQMIISAIRILIRLTGKVF